MIDLFQTVDTVVVGVSIFGMATTHAAARLKFNGATSSHSFFSASYLNFKEKCYSIQFHQRKMIDEHEVYLSTILRYCWPS